MVFALARLPEGGCILADEVGLGKTIEAGLVIAQRLAEGARPVLLLTATPIQNSLPAGSRRLSQVIAFALTGVTGCVALA